MDVLIIFAVVAGVVAFVTVPLRNPRSVPAEGANERELAELDAAREAKYREIRDAELDHRTGKLSDEDYQAVDRALRSEAVEILHAIDTIERP